VGGALVAIVLLLIGVLLCWRKLLNRRKGGVPLTGRRPFFSQQPSSQPITPTSLTFPTNSNYIDGTPVTYATQSGWYPQQTTPLTLSGGASAAMQTSAAPQQSDSAPPAVNTWIQRAPVVQQDNYSGLAFQAPHAESSVDPRELYGNAVRGPAHSAAAPMTVTNSASAPAGGASSPAPPYYFTPFESEKTGTV